MTNTHWIAGYRAPLVNPAEEIKLAEPRAFDGETVRQVVRMAGGGSRLRVRLTNRYGTGELAIGAARIAIRKTDGEIVPETEQQVRFEGAASVRIPAGADIVSDPVEFAVAAGTELALSLYLP
ncbi:SGNH/GDSL hydrolase family protein, partial [Nocardia sp. NPDC004722]